MYANQLADGLPGQTFANPLLQQDTLNEIINTFELPANDPCQDRSITKVQVTKPLYNVKYNKKGELAHVEWDERWTFDHCGKPWVYSIGYMFDRPMGGWTFVVSLE